jgi:hypothetical protein
LGVLQADGGWIDRAQDILDKGEGIISAIVCFMRFVNATQLNNVLLFCF